ncbi:MAG: hypothetical protein ACQESF_02490 [Nanobdellota archaeon]
MDNLEKIIASESVRKIKKNNLSLVSNIYLSYFAHNLSDSALNEDLTTTTIKDYYRALGGNLKSLKNINKEPGKLLSKFKNLNLKNGEHKNNSIGIPSIESAICKECYKSLLKKDKSAELTNNAASINDLKLILLVDHTLDSLINPNIASELPDQPKDCLRKLIKTKEYEKDLDKLNDIKSDMLSYKNMLSELIAQEPTFESAEKILHLKTEITKTLKPVKQYTKDKNYQKLIAPLEELYNSSISSIENYIRACTIDIYESINIPKEPTYDIEKDYNQTKQALNKLEKAKYNYTLFGYNTSSIDENIKSVEESLSYYTKIKEKTENYSRGIKSIRDLCNFIENISYETLTQDQLNTLYDKKKRFTISPREINNHTIQYKNELDLIKKRLTSVKQNKKKKLHRDAVKYAKALDVDNLPAGDINKAYNVLEEINAQYSKAENTLKAMNKSIKQIEHIPEKIENKKINLGIIKEELELLSFYVNKSLELSYETKDILFDSNKKLDFETTCNNIFQLDKSIYYFSKIIQEGDCRSYITDDILEKVNSVNTDRKIIERKLDYTHDLLFENFQKINEKREKMDSKNNNYFRKVINKVNPVYLLRKEENKHQYQKFKESIDFFCKIYCFHEKGYYRKFVPEREPKFVS